MSDIIDAALRQFYGRLDITDEQRAIFPVCTEMCDRATDLVAVPPLDQIGAAGMLEIAKVLTRFDRLIDDEWRDNLIRLGAGLLKQMQQHGEG